jgi:regulatory protein YycH of two-component signal transduction system YycFG
MDNSLFKFNLLKKENEISIQNSLITERNRQNKFLLIGLVIISITLSIAVWAFIQKNKSAKKIAAQKKEIEEKQKEIIDSINYAKRIQQSLLPTIKYIAKKIK